MTDRPQKKATLDALVLCRAEPCEMKPRAHREPSSMPPRTASGPLWCQLAAIEGKKMSAASTKRSVVTTDGCSSCCSCLVLT